MMYLRGKKAGKFGFENYKTPVRYSQKRILF